MKNQLRHVDFLDALRGIAILGVLLVHSHGGGTDFAPWKGWFRTFAPEVNLWFYPFNWGRAGVAIFFVISGFCIHLSFRQAEQTWRGFFIRRFFRLYPAYFLALIFVMVMLDMRHLSLAVQRQIFWVQLSTHLVFIHNWFPSTFLGVNPPLWSLAVEVQLYLIYPALLMLVARLGWRRSMMILAAIELCLQGARGWARETGAADTAAGHAFEILANCPLGYWFSWALGARIADAFLKNQPLPFLNIPPLFWLGLAVAADFVRPLQPFWFLLFALAAAGFISRRLNETKPGVVTLVLSLKLLTKIGLWSYGIYLLHYPLLEVYTNAVDWFFPLPQQSGATLVLLMFGMWAAIIPLGWLWYKAIELPGIAFGKSLLKRTDDGVRPQTESNRQCGGNPAVATAPAYGLNLGILLVVVIGNVMAGAKFAPAPPVEFAKIAWSLATNPEASKRDGALAIKYAEKACRQTDFGQPTFIGVLAAAYAEAGKFNQAMATAQYATNLAAQNRDTNTLQLNQALLRLYANHQPYHNGGTGGH